MRQFIAYICCLFWSRRSKSTCCCWPSSVLWPLENGKLESCRERLCSAWWAGPGQQGLEADYSPLCWRRAGWFLFRSSFRPCRWRGSHRYQRARYAWRLFLWPAEVRIGHRRRDTIAGADCLDSLASGRHLSLAGSHLLLGPGVDLVISLSGKSRFVENFPTPRNHRSPSGSFYSAAFSHDRT
jgi:hypothetical protein